MRSLCGRRRSSDANNAFVVSDVERDLAFTCPLALGAAGATRGCHGSVRASAGSQSVGAVASPADARPWAGVGLRRCRCGRYRLSTRSHGVSISCRRGVWLPARATISRRSYRRQRGRPPRRSRPRCGLPSRLPHRIDALDLRFRRLVSDDDAPYPPGSRRCRRADRVRVGSSRWRAVDPLARAERDNGRGAPRPLGVDPRDGASHLACAGGRRCVARRGFGDLLSRDPPHSNRAPTCERSLGAF